MMVLDYWAHRHAEDPKLREEAINPDFEADVAEFERQSAALADAEQAPPQPASPADPPAPADPGDWETVTEERV
jgi:hypothetical protein